MNSVFKDASRLGERYRHSRKTFLKKMLAEVSRLLRTEYLLDLNSSNKMLKSFFADDFLPLWYFYSNRPEDIAGHIFIMTQMMSPDVEYLEQVSEDGKAITYILNVGRDYPGKLARIIGENREFGVVAYDSVKTNAGVRIITIENDSDRDFGITQDERYEIDTLVASMRMSHAKSPCIELFLQSLPLNYLYEECKSFSPSVRLERHFAIFGRVLEEGRIVARVEDTFGESDDEKLDKVEKRIYLGIPNPDREFVLRVLEVFEEREINLNRSYYNLFAAGDDEVGIMSVYTHPDVDLDGIEDELCARAAVTSSGTGNRIDRIGRKLEQIIRVLSDPSATDPSATDPSATDPSATDIAGALDTLEALVAENSNTATPNEYAHFLLNSYSDFLRATQFLGIRDRPALLKRLLGFDSLNVYYVGSTHNGKKRNLPGFRAKHNVVRGIAYKGGLRIDPIVDFAEVAALAFMMTWKCARTKILFGGAKGGLVLDRSLWRDSRLDYFDTLANFGSALFLVTGPSEDVPAGDVGCGPAEIGHLFEGFKTTLRELALLASGMKHGVARIGNKIISIERANKILTRQFDVDILDDQILEKLVSSEEYLELVTAAQITGKPKMGIDARTGATGRGLCYTILAAVTKLYLLGEWESTGEVSDAERKLLERVAGLTERSLVEFPGQKLITDEDWNLLTATVYPKLLSGKRLAVQGSGKVGSAIMRELDAFGVHLVGVADAGGAIFGDKLEVDDVLQSVARSDDRTVIHTEAGVTKRIVGAREGAAVLEAACDILIPAALENAITAANADAIKAGIVACGSNGTTTSKAEIILEKRKNLTVIYDFLANSGGVTASYFEWLRNLYQRHRYEAEEILGQPFDIHTMDPYIMPEFRDRIRDILLAGESAQTTREWNHVLRDILICAVNEDFDFAREHGVSMRTAGFVNAQLRVLAALCMGLRGEDLRVVWDMFPEKTKTLLKPFLEHPETRLFSSERDEILAVLYDRVEN